MTKKKREEIRALAEAWHHALVALANKPQKKTAPNPSRN
jgi:hypothetical protein